MTMPELEALIEGRTVIRHQGRCFIVSHDQEEAVRFRDLGAHVSMDTHRGYFDAEIYLDGLLGFVGEPDPDDPELVHDVRQRVVLEHFRSRDGFASPMQERWAAAEVQT